MPGLTDGGERLPDEELVRKPGAIGWAPGALEGVLGRYGSGEGDGERVGELHAALVALADRPGRRSRARVCELFRRGDVRASIDPLIEHVADEPPRDQERLYLELRRLLIESGRRDEVKFAIALVGPFGHPQDAEVFRTLGRHEEFTVYAAVALGYVVDDPVAERGDLLRHVSGWGRTELASLLLRDPTPEVRDLLLRRGLGVGNALELAVGCELHEALAAPEVDDELLDGARGIVDSLTWSFDSPDTLLDYPDGAIAVERLLTHLAPRARALDELLTAYELRRFVHSDDERREEAGFDAARVARIDELCDAIVGRPEWRPLTEAALASGDRVERWRALQAAKLLELPLHDYVVAQIEAHPNDGGLWFEFCREADEERIDEAIALAERTLDLDAIATGPALDVVGPFGDEHPHQALDFLLQELPRFPGRGWSLLRVALRSPVIRHRRVALRALAAWPRDLLDGDVRAALEACLRDPDEHVRDESAAVIAGRPPPQG